MESSHINILDYPSNHFIYKGDFYAEGFRKWINKIVEF